MASSSKPAGAFDAIIPSASTLVASSSGTKHIPYDVFINHRGQDTKRTVATSIYKSLNSTGLRVFLDELELELGDSLPEALEKAMATASLHIAIFSEHYAQSPWCLAELEFMVKTRTTIIPIFYRIEPSVLRWADGGKGIYAEDFLKHEEKGKYSGEVLQRWKEALQQVSYYKGEIIKNNVDEHRVVKKVANLVMNKMSKVPLEVAKFPVGLDEAVQDFNTIALQSAGSTSIVGIWGMGGCGKTTLAKEIFNRRGSAMKKSSFLFDLRDAAGNGKLVEKQKKLLKDLKVNDESFDHVDAGKGIINSRLGSLSVLIVLDDVDHVDQLDALLPPKESLGGQSLIIVTTRNADVLHGWGISAIYPMRLLNDTHARQLFCWHAFLQEFPPPEFKDLVDGFLIACKGLPLSLKVMGAQLNGRFDKDYWQCTLNKFSQIPHEDITKRLKVSYDALGKQEKEMFLDSACLFIGKRKSAAIAAWEAEWHGLLGWEILFNKCLVEEDEDGLLRMHDHLRDMGRDIANGLSPHRLWSLHQVIEIPNGQKAIRVRGMGDAVGDRCYHRQGEIIIHTSQGERSLALRSLGLKIFFGNAEILNPKLSQLSGELIWLECYGFGHKCLSSWLSLKKLRILELSYSYRLKHLWKREADAPSQLRELFLRECESLEIFPKSIGHLKNLKKIVIKEYMDCHKAVSLPEEFCHLQSLEHLEISRNIDMSSLPSNFGKLTNLRHLDLDCVALEVLPDSFKKLTLLEYLDLSFCYRLTKLHVPENMTKLRYLNLDDCYKLEELRLPEVASLTELHLKMTSLKELPGNIFQLTELTELEIGSEFLTALPTSKISKRSSGSGCILKRINLTCTKVSKISISGDCCPSLETLYLSSNWDLRELETLPGTLKTLYIGNCDVLKDIRGVRGLKILQNLQIENCKELDGLPCFAELVSLEILKFKWCRKVKKIEGLQELSSLRELAIELDELPSFAKFTSLKEFALQRCEKLEKIESLEHLKSLEKLWIYGCPELNGLPGLAELTSLKEFDLQMCHKLKKIALQQFTVSDCQELETLPSIASLEIFRLLECHKLEKIEGLENLRSLKILSIRNCPQLDGLLSLAELASLESLYLERCPKLEKLRIRSCPQLYALSDYPGLPEFTSLKEFELESCLILEKLSISNCPQLDVLSLAELTSLKKNYLERCHRLEKIKGLENIRSLENLKISDCSELEVLPNLSEMASLKELQLKKFYKLEKIEGLENIRSLENLKISDYSELEALPNLSEMTFLKKLQLKKCPKMKKIEGLENIRSLENLKISDCSELEALPNLSEMTSLKEFQLEKCYKLEKIEGLERLRLLEKLEVHTRWNAPCIVSLEHSERLESLVVVANHTLAVEPFVCNLQKWPRKVVICMRAVCDVYSLKNLFENLSNVSVLDSSDSDVEVHSSDYDVEVDSTATLICLIIDSDHPDLRYSTDFGSYEGTFSTELGKGKWVLMGAFTEASQSDWSNADYISARNSKGDYVAVKVEAAWLVTVEEGTMVEAFHQLFRRGLN